MTEQSEQRSGEESVQHMQGQSDQLPERRPRQGGEEGRAGGGRGAQSHRPAYPSPHLVDGSQNLVALCTHPTDWGASGGARGERGGAGHAHQPPR